MPHKNTLIMQPIEPASLIKRSLIGAGIALLLIGIFLFSVKNPNPDWPKYWMLRPLIVVPLAGAAGGGFSYLINRLLHKNDGQKTMAILLSFLMYIIGLWLGTV